MSYDRDLKHECPHTVVDEALYLSKDRQSVVPLRPISNIQTVKLCYNRLVDVPSVGQYTPATLKGVLSGPFSCPSGTVVVSLNDNVATIQVPPCQKILASDLAKLLNKQCVGFYFQAKQGKLQLISQLKGPSKSLTVTGGTVSTLLGFTLQRTTFGQTILPGWTLVNDPYSLTDRPKRIIVFDEPLKGSSDFFEVSYATVAPECRRCGGQNLEDDWRYQSQGDVKTVRGTDLLAQDVLKIIFTEKGSNPFHSWYGTGIVNAIGRKMSERSLLQSTILSDLRDAFRRWQNVKTQQETVIGQAVSDGEFPSQLLVTDMYKDPNDPTILYITATVQSRSGEVVGLSRGLQLPQDFSV